MLQADAETHAHHAQEKAMQEPDGTRWLQKSLRQELMAAAPLSKLTEW